MPEDFNTVKDEDQRFLYVAMTRAKQNMIVHSNSNNLDGFSAENLDRMEDYRTKVVHFTSS
jgi:ATP-dependent DNA helicase RecQ